MRYSTTDRTRKVRDLKPVKSCGLTIQIGTSCPAVSHGANCFTILQHEMWKFCRQIFTFGTFRGKRVDLEKAEIPPCYERLEANPYPPKTGGLSYDWVTLGTRASANVYHVGFVLDRLFPNFIVGVANREWRPFFLWRKFTCCNGIIVLFDSIEVCWG